MRGVEDEDLGCAYPLDDAGGIPPIPCGAARQPGSSFCPEHHVLCHIPAGSMAECRTLDEAEALARVVGGRLGRELRAPPEPLLRRLDRISRLFSCPDRSCIVHGESMAKRPTAKLDNAITAGLGPTPERLRHGLVEPIAQPIARRRGFPCPLRGGAARPSARPRPDASARRRDRPESRQGSAGPAHRGGAPLGLACHPGGRRHGVAGRLVPVARARLGIAGQGMGLATGLERPPRQPGNRLRHPDRRPRSARIAPRPRRIFAEDAFLT